MRAGPPSRRRRALSDEERRLWAEVARHVVPMPGRARPAPEPPPPAAPAAAPAATTPVVDGPAPRPALPAPAAPKPPVKPLLPLDRKTARKLARGSRQVDASIDLHGLTQTEAHGALLHFVARTHAAGHALVLVVTGKGRDETGWTGEGGRGVLRRLVPLWLSAPALRALVLGFEEAAPHRGGMGALYVRLRRRG